ncbi:chemotaxis protein CheA [bacterium]|nr:chemotaxis protein CheA [bacterium]
MSTDHTITLDDELLKGFLDESLDFLSELDSLFVELEGDPNNIDVVNAIFRPIHSIKGNAPFFGYTKLRTLAHEMETILALVRERALIANKEMIGTLLRGTDEIKAILNRVGRGEAEIGDLTAFTCLVEETKALSDKSELSPEQLWTGLLKSLSTLSAGIPNELREEMNRLQKFAQKLCPVAQRGGDSDSSGPKEMSLTDITKELLAQNEEEEPPTEAIKSHLEEILTRCHHDESKSAITSVLDAYDPYVSSIGLDELMRDMILEALTICETHDQEYLIQEENTPEPATPTPESTPQNTSAESAPSPKSKSDSGKSMRVSEEHIDTFLSHIGELFIVGELLSYLERKLVLESVSSEVVREYRDITESFSHLSHDLQHSVMSIRKVPVKNLTQKVPRLVRDIAADQSKQIQVIQEGQDTEVDKSLIELLDAPLTHMVRNSADHGIELPEVRSSLGKDPQGTITLTVAEDDKFVTLTVQDDGKGLDLEAIQTKAEAMNLIRAGETLTNEDVVDFLFAAGVSTAEQVTDVSGRGVGMDVVKRAIIEAGGEISVETETGQGCTFTIQVPKTVTTQILEGLIFEIGAQCFVLPLDRVNEAFACSESEFFQAAGEDSFIFRHEKMLPIVPARTLLSLPVGRKTSEKKNLDSTQHIVSVQANRRDVGIWTDSIIGVQQVVVKEVRNIGGRSEIYNGGALMGDGRIALILDIDKLSENYDQRGLAKRGSSHESSQDSQHQEVENHDAQEVVIARIGEDLIAFPLEEVNRLEKFSQAEVEFASGLPSVQYRSGILPLYDFVNVVHDQEESHSSQERLFPETFHTVVYRNEEQQAGFVVDEIFDIVTEELSLEKLDSTPCIQGTAIIRGKVTTVLNLGEILSQKTSSEENSLMA